MLQSSRNEADFGLSVAKQLAATSVQDSRFIFEDLRRGRRLSEAVHHLNKLLNDPEHRELAATALNRLGFDLKADLARN